MGEPLNLDDEPTAEELAEADALRVALERGRGAPELPGDALATASLLRYSRDRGELDDERSEAILKDALDSAVVAPDGAGVAISSSLARWFFGLMTAAAAAFALYVAVPIDGRAPSVAIRGSALPAPPVQVLEAQGRVLATASDLSELSLAMGPYRTALYETAAGGLR